jgi:hypothetical protein
MHQFNAARLNDRAVKVVGLAAQQDEIKWLTYVL